MESQFEHFLHRQRLYKTDHDRFNVFVQNTIGTSVPTLKTIKHVPEHIDLFELCFVCEFVHQDSVRPLKKRFIHIVPISSLLWTYLQIYTGQEEHSWKSIIELSDQKLRVHMLDTLYLEHILFAALLSKKNKSVLEEAKVSLWDIFKKKVLFRYGDGFALPSDIQPIIEEQIITSRCNYKLPPHGRTLLRKILDDTVPLNVKDDELCPIVKNIHSLTKKSTYSAIISFQKAISRDIKHPLYFENETEFKEFERSLVSLRTVIESFKDISSYVNSNKECYYTEQEKCNTNAQRLQSAADFVDLKLKSITKEVSRRRNLDKDGKSLKWGKRLANWFMFE